MARVSSSGGGTHIFKIGGNNACMTFSGVMQNNGGPGAIPKSGNGTLTLAGAKTFTGIVSIDAGTISMENWNLSGTAGMRGPANNKAARSSRNVPLCAVDAGYS